MPGKTLDSASRVNAGALLDSEQKAAMPIPQAPPAPAATPAPAAKKEGGVRSIETYQGDIEKLVENKNVSVVSIAAAEAARRGTTSLGGESATHREPLDWQGLLRRGGMIGGGILMFTAAALLLYYVLQPAKTVQVSAAQVSPFITVDATKVLTIPADNTLTHADVITALDQERTGVSLSLGLIERLYIAFSSTTADGQQSLMPLTVQQVLQFLSPNVPDTLLRSVDPQTYLLGIHVYQDNQPFIILKATSYEEAYAAMLAWEPYMQHDLAPFFTRVPPVKISNTPSQTTGTSTQGVASTTDTAPAQFYTPPAVFVDQIVENQNARVIEDADGNILLLWTFLDRNTLVITTSDVTLREIISRLTSAPVVPTP